MTTATFTALVLAEPVFSYAERLALAGFLAGYTGLTREAYALDLHQFTTWCQQHHLYLFQARRAGIECFARDLEAKGRARATVTREAVRDRGGSTITRSRKNCSSTRPPLMSAGRGWTATRTRSGWTVTSSARSLVATGLGAAAEHALASLLALIGLRVSEATGATSRP